LRRKGNRVRDDGGAGHQREPRHQGRNRLQLFNKVLDQLRQGAQFERHGSRHVRHALQHTAHELLAGLVDGSHRHHVEGQHALVRKSARRDYELVAEVVQPATFGVARDNADHCEHDQPVVLFAGLVFKLV